VVGRGQDKPTVSKMDDFGHLANLSAIAYDRGSTFEEFAPVQLAYESAYRAVESMRSESKA